MSRHCHACKKKHKNLYFPSPVSTQCATSMLNNNRTPLSTDNELAFIRAVAEVETASGLPIREWVGVHRKWHVTLSEKLYVHAMENPSQMRNTKRIEQWVQEEHTFATSN